MKTTLEARLRNNSDESGQGFLEYSVIIGLLVIIVISFVALFGVDLYNAFFGDRAAANEGEATLTPAEPLLELNETGTLMDIFDTEIIDIENCTDSEPYNPIIERNLRLAYDLELGDDFPPDLRPRVIEELQARAGITLGLTEERPFSLNLEAPPDSRANYTIDWLYTWSEGNITVTQPDGSSQSYTYRLRTDIGYEIANIEQQICEATPYP